MPYRKDPVPVGASVEELVRYYDNEFNKLEQETSEHISMIEALDIIGVTATWFFDDVLSGVPAAGFMTLDNNTMSATTQINVNFESAQGKSIVDLLRTSTIKEGDLIGLTNIAGLGGGNYLVSGAPVFQVDHIEIPVDTFRGQSGNPTNNDVMALRWEFATAPGQFQI